MGFLAPALLAGLAALAIPPIVHLLNRRRFDVMDWAAMQFLKVSERTRKKIFLEQFLLMLLRMGLLLLIVLGMASPWLKAPWLARIAPAPSRDVVLVLDGSFSMGYVHDGRTAHDAAKAWAADLLGQLQAGDAVAVVHARQQPVPLVGYLSTDLDLARSAVAEAPKPRGGTNMTAAVREAVTLMKASGKGVRDVIVLTDGQRHGWADPKSLERWELLAGGIPEGDLPNLWVVNVVPERPADVPNWSLAPIQSSRAVAAVGREVKFKTELQLHGAGVKPPGKIKIEVDGRPAGDYAPPSIADKGRIPVVVPQRFMTPGSHLVTLTIDEDAMPGDNRQDYAVGGMGGKRGVGLIVTLSGPTPGTTPTRLSVDAVNAPYQLEIYASGAEAAPADPGAWGAPLAGTAYSETPDTVTADLPPGARHALVWLRELGPDDACSGSNPYRGALGEITVTG